jgi:hypothetical protein
MVKEKDGVSWSASANRAQLRLTVAPQLDLGSDNGCIRLHQHTGAHWRVCSWHTIGTQLIPNLPTKMSRNVLRVLSAAGLNLESYGPLGGGGGGGGFQG